MLTVQLGCPSVRPHGVDIRGVERRPARTSRTVWTMNERQAWRQAWKANREWVSCVRVSWHSLARGGHVDDSVPQQHNTTSCTPADASTLVARDVATLWSRFSASELKFPDRHFLESSLASREAASRAAPCACKSANR